MAKEILIYGGIWSWQVAELVREMNEASIDEGLVARINSDGGSPEDGWSLVAKFNEFTGTKSVKIDGRAYSTGLFLACYAQNVEAVDVSNFMLHRAGYSSYYEGSEFFTDAIKGNLININKSLRAAFESKVDVKLFEQMKGVKVKDIFDVEQPRTDVFFNAKEAKKFGLVDKIVQITPARKKKIAASMHGIAAFHDSDVSVEEIEEEIIDANVNNDDLNKDNLNKNTMKNKGELLAAYPALCAELKSDGVTEEKTRVGAWMANITIDAKAVITGIDSGNAFTQKDMAEFGVKQTAAIAKKGLTAESTEDLNIDPDNADKGDGGKKPTELDAIAKEVDAQLNLEPVK